MRKNSQNSESLETFGNVVCATLLACELYVLVNSKQYGAAESRLYISILTHMKYISNSNAEFEVLLIYY